MESLRTPKLVSLKSSSYDDRVKLLGIFCMYRANSKDNFFKLFSVEINYA